MNASGTIDHVLARNQQVKVGSKFCGTGIGIRAYADTIASVVTIQNNTVSAYDGSGISASAPELQATIRNNSILGLGVIKIDIGPQGITLFDDVVATVSGNSVVNNPLGYSAGIGVVAASGAMISKNYLGNNGNGIAFYTFSGDPNSDNSTVTGNEVFGSTGDGIAICGSNNLVTGNTVSNNAESGVNLTSDFGGGTQCVGDNNTVTANNINGACAGVLIDPAATGNTIGSNKMFNDTSLQLSGTSCTGGQQTQKEGRLRARFSKSGKSAGSE